MDAAGTNATLAGWHWDLEHELYQREAIERGDHYPWYAEQPSIHNQFQQQRIPDIRKRFWLSAAA
jgi:hypothetical protein